MSSRVTEELKLLAKAIKSWISASSFGWLPYSSFLDFISRPFFASDCRMFFSYIIRLFTVQAIELDNLEQQCLEFSNRDDDSKTPRTSRAKSPPFLVSEEQLEDDRVSMLSFPLRNLAFLWVWHLLQLRTKVPGSCLGRAGSLTEQVRSPRWHNTEELARRSLVQ